MKIIIKFKETPKGQRAENKYHQMIKEGMSIGGALEILQMHGYINEIETNLYI